MKDLNANQLVALIRDGDVKAFDEFYRQNWRALYQMAYHATGSVEDAKDLVQNVFINFWNRKESIDPAQYHSSYLFTSLRNGIINLHKKDTGKKKSELELLRIDDQPSYSGEDHYIAKEFALMLNKQVEELPAKMQQVFVLSRYEHLSIAEISQSLNITQRTVKNQLSNALKILRTKVGTYCLIIIVFLFY